jgi:hypothetical protein
LSGNVTSHPKETKTKGKRPFGRVTSRWEDNIRMNVKDIECEDVDWIHLAEHEVQ